MLKQFENKLNEMRGLVNDEHWSAFLISTDKPHILLAVSGGVDSMVMADLFLKVLGPNAFALGHCNFHLRGQESDGDQALVQSWATQNAVRFHKVDFDTETYAKENSLSIEMAARDLRYRWFVQLCRDYDYIGTAVAHNANDNAETLMLNMLRGTGLDGLRGMSAVSDFPIKGAEGLKLLRPLLCFTRKQIEGYAFAWKVNYRNDSTNLESDYKRNRLRNEVFPHFSNINPSFIRTINQEMQYFSEAGDIVQSWCESASKGVVSSVSGTFGDGLRIDVEALIATGHWRYLLYYILSPYGFNSSVLSSVEALLSSQRTLPGKRFESENYILLTGRGELSVFLKNNINAFVLMGNEGCESIMPVRGVGVYHFNGRTFKVETLQWKNGMPLKQPDGVIVLDSAKLKFPFVLRCWRAGDWFLPLGLKGRKLLSDMFTDMKYDTQAKASAVVVADVQSEEMAQVQHVISLACLRIDEGYKVTSDTTEVIRISEL